jgi:hypothetical protein
LASSERADEQGSEAQEGGRDKTQPAQIKIKELLSDEYEFKFITRDDSRNIQDLEKSGQARLLPPMANTVPGALLGVLESVFGAEVPEADMRKAIKKRWPGKWVPNAS